MRSSYLCYDFNKGTNVNHAIKILAYHGVFANCFLSEFAPPTHLQKCLFSFDCCEKFHEKKTPHSKRQEMCSIRTEKRKKFVGFCKLLRIFRN